MEANAPKLKKPTRIEDPAILRAVLADSLAKLNTLGGTRLIDEALSHAARATGIALARCAHVPAGEGAHYVCPTHGDIAPVVVVCCPQCAAAADRAVHFQLERRIAPAGEGKP